MHVWGVHFNAVLATSHASSEVDSWATKHENLGWNCMCWVSWLRICRGFYSSAVAHVWKCFSMLPWLLFMLRLGWLWWLRGQKVMEFVNVIIRLGRHGFGFIADSIAVQLYMFGGAFQCGFGYFSRFDGGSLGCPRGQTNMVILCGIICIGRHGFELVPNQCIC